MELAVTGRLGDEEHAGIVVSVQVTVQGSAHLGVGVVELHVDGVDRMTHAGLGDDGVLAVGGDHAEGARQGLLGLFAGEGRIGVAHAHRETQAQGVREADPLGGVTAIHEVVVLQEFGARGGHFLEDFDGLVQFVEELHIDLVQRVVEVHDAAVLGVRDGTVVVGNLMHGRDLQDLREGEFILEPEFRRLVHEGLVTSHAILVFHGEHAAVPAIVHIPAGVVAVAEGRGHVAAPGLTAQVVHDLVVGIQVGAVPVDDDGALQLLEHTAHGQAVLGQIVLAHAVSVLVQLLVAFGAARQKGRGGREGEETFQYILHIHIALII